MRRLAERAPRLRREYHGVHPAVQPMLDNVGNGANYSFAALDVSIPQQAAMTACLNDFKPMFPATLLVIAPLLPIRPTRRSQKRRWCTRRWIDPQGAV